MNLKLFYCQHCGKIIAIVKNSCSKTMCCEHPMLQLHVNASHNLLEDNSTNFTTNSKHCVPIISVKGKTISVTLGSKISTQKQFSPSKQLDWLLIQSGITSSRLNNPAFSQITTPQDFSTELDFAVMSGERVEADFSLF